MAAAFAVVAAGGLALAEPVPDRIRVATYAPELDRKGPGLLLRDIVKGEDPQVQAVVEVIAEVDPDILLLTGFDFDHANAALAALAGRLSEAGSSYPHLFSLRPNSGMATGLDMDGNGRTGEARDAQGFGYFAGYGGMALMSRYPIDSGQVTDLSAVLWRNLPGATLPEVDGAPFPSAEALGIQRLSSVGHWVVPVMLPGGMRTDLLAFSAGPPVFDGPEDRNGKRNADELHLWLRLLDGELPAPPPPGRFVLLGNANLDPIDGDGLHPAIADLLADSRLQDPRPESRGGREQADASHRGDPALDTVDWRDAADGGPGNLRVDYVLPSADWATQGAGVFWPDGGPGTESAQAASRHRLVWVDLDLGSRR